MSRSPVRSDVANMPTEELYTSPLKTGVNGVVYASMPLVHDGSIIDGFHFVVRDGKDRGGPCPKGRGDLRGAISVDEGASYFGEIALVPYRTAPSPTRRFFLQHAL